MFTVKISILCSEQVVTCTRLTRWHVPVSRGVNRPHLCHKWRPTTPKCLKTVTKKNGSNIACREARKENGDDMRTALILFAALATACADAGQNHRRKTTRPAGPRLHMANSTQRIVNARSGSPSVSPLTIWIAASVLTRRRDVSSMRHHCFLCPMTATPLLVAIRRMRIGRGGNGRQRTHWSPPAPAKWVIKTKCVSSAAKSSIGTATRLTPEGRTYGCGTCPSSTASACLLKNIAMQRRPKVSSEPA